MSEKILKINKRFLKIYTYIFIIQLIYSLVIMNFMEGRTIDYLIYIPIGVVFSTNFICLITKYWNNKYIYIVVKLVTLIFTAFLPIYRDFSIFQSYILLLLYFLVAYEQIFIASSFNINRLTIIMSVIIPIVFSTLICAFFRESFSRVAVDIIAFVAVSIIFAYCVVNTLFDFAKDFEFRIVEQNKLINEVKQSNETLLVTQRKFKIANELLEQQKLDIEEAYKTIDKANSEMFIQNEILGYISSSLELEDLLEVISDAIIGAMGVDTCAVVIKDTSTKTNMVKIKTSAGQSSEVMLRDAIENGAFNEYENSTSPFIDNNVVKGKYSFSNSATASILIMPLTKSETSSGFLFIEKKNTDMLKNAVQFFTGIVNQVNIAVNNAKLYMKMENMAVRDGLTQIYNRAHLMKCFQQYIAEAIQNKYPFSVGLFDIDKFKKVNDTYGHMFGDEAIKVVAHVAERISEKHGGIAGRFGGEEFVVLLPNYDIEPAYKIISEMHEEIKATPLFYNGEEVHINVSIGLTCYPSTCQNPSDLLNRADWSMYYSKQNGRGRITIDSDSIREQIDM